jgi:uncharacterized protein with beta-barrel porin domain
MKRATAFVRKRHPRRSGASRFASLSFLAAACCAVVTSAHAIVLFDNLSQQQDGIEPITTTRWLGSQFRTDSGSYLIDSITLKLQENINGVVAVSIYSDSGGRPGEELGVFSATQSIGGSTGNIVFRNERLMTFDQTIASEDLSSALNLPKDLANRLFGGPTRIRITGVQGSGVMLEPGSSYWIVTQALSGQFASGYSAQETGDGVGYTPIWSHSEDAGNSWTTETASPLFLQVVANPANLLQTDQEAILSAIFSGLPMAMAQREAVFAVVRDVTRDVNERLFRLRTDAELAEVKGWQAFATAGYGSADTDTSLPAVGFQTDTVSGSVGAEYHATPQWVVGGAFTYVESQNTFGSGLGDVDIEGESVAGYVSFLGEHFYASFLYAFGSFEHDIQRDTLFNNTASAEPNSRAHTLQFNAAYNAKVGAFTTGPYVGLDYVIGELESYQEAGGSTAILRVPGQNFDSLISRLGWQLARTYEVGSVKVTPQVRVAWAHEYRNDSEAVDVALARSPFRLGSDPGSPGIGRFGASADSQPPARDCLEIGAAVGIYWQDRFGIIVDYGARLLQGDAAAHYVSLTGSLKF